MPAIIARARQRSCVLRSSARGSCLRLKARPRSSETAVVAATDKVPGAALYSTKLDLYRFDRRSAHRSIAHIIPCRP